MFTPPDEGQERDSHPRRTGPKAPPRRQKIDAHGSRFPETRKSNLGSTISRQPTLIPFNGFSLRPGKSRENVKASEQVQQRKVKSQAELKGSNRMRLVEYWLTFWKRTEGGNGKSEVRQRIEDKRTEKGDRKWKGLSL